MPPLPPEATTLDEAALRGEACAVAGLDDFGPDEFSPHLSALLQSLEHEGGLHEMGRATQHARIVDSLVARLRAQAYFSRHPEILDERIDAPLVIVGLARSGTTRLHRLLSCDPLSLTAAWWEVRAPAPDPAADPAGEDPRIADAAAAVEQILAASPLMATIHPWDHAGADEEIMLLEHSFLSHVPESGANVPSYRAHVDSSALDPAYAYLKKMLQFLQWQKRQRGITGERWVLKAPFHLGYLKVLFRVFPGARIIQTHRDPLETVNSAASMYAALWELASDNVDRHEVGQQVQARYAWALSRCLEVRAENEAAFVDVDYRAVGRAPIAEIERIYHELGLSLGSDARAAMERWLRDNPREGRPPHEYTLEEFGLERDGIEAAFADYRRRFIL